LEHLLLKFFQIQLNQHNIQILILQKSFKIKEIQENMYIKLDLALYLIKVSNINFNVILEKKKLKNQNHNIRFIKKDFK